MILKKLKIRNIRSYDEFEIDFPKGSTLLSGDIGSGKTSVLLAIQFALFGLQPGQKGHSILRQGESEARVSLLFEIDGEEIEIQRGLKKSKNNSISQDLNIISINGRTEELSSSEMKNKVISLLKYPKEFITKSNLLYKFTVYTPQEEMKSIIEERTDVRLDILRHIFGIDRYKQIKENSQIFIQRIKESVKLKEGGIQEINLLKERFNKENEEKIRIAKEINNLEIEHRKISDEKNQLERELRESEKLIEERRNFDSELLSRKVELKGKREFKARLEKETLAMQHEIREKKDFSQKNLDNVILLIQKHKSLLEDISSKLVSVSTKISVLNSKKDSSINMKNKIISMENCPTCLQKVGDEHKKRLDKMTQFDIDEINSELELRIAEKAQIVRDNEKEKELISGYEQDRAALESDKIRFEHQKAVETKMKSDAFILDRTINEISSLEKEILDIEEKMKKYEKTDEIFRQAKAKFDAVIAKSKNLEISLAESKKEFEILKKHLRQLEEDIILKEKIRQQLNYLRQLQDWLQEKFLSMIAFIETNVLATLRSEFSKIFSEWFSVLVQDDLSVRLDEEFTPIVTNKDYDTEYSFLSGGERTAVALAYRLALNQVLNSILSNIKTKDIIILDEPTEGFSSEQLDKMRDIFEQLKAEQIILVSHEQKIESFVDHVIRIKKDIISGIETR